MTPEFQRVEVPANLHGRVTRALAVQVIRAERASQPIVFPNEAQLCQQLGVSRSILREAVKVLADKGMLEVRPRAGTRSKPRAEWNLLDPDILGWQAELEPDANLLREICEVRLAIEPTASSFAALRATPEEMDEIQRCLERREARIASANREEAVDLDLRFQSAVVAASHNALFRHLNAMIREPFRAALSLTVQLPASVALGIEGYRALFQAIRGRDPLAARNASADIVGLAMLAVEQVIRSQEQAR
ncbi:MAG TPA: FCD domain-containing protein [Bryobacteraceae bacterium]|nr:FCD domain-containing protein [Bryobacteraceae bacterium]